MQRVFSPLFLALLLFTPHTLTLAAQQADDATVQQYSRAAEDALSRKDPDAAIVALEKLTHLTPGNAAGLCQPWGGLLHPGPLPPSRKSIPNSTPLGSQHTPGPTYAGHVRHGTWADKGGYPAA